MINKVKLKDILYVEDDKDIADIVVMTLKDIGKFNVRYKPLAKDGIKEAKKKKPQLMIIDVMMPEMDGPTMLEKMQKDADLKDIPVIFMTAKAQYQEQELYLAMGAIGVIVKPFDPMTLCDEVNEMWNSI